MARMMLGKKPAGLLIEIRVETCMVIAGGYSRGAGSKAAGSLRGNGFFHRCLGSLWRNIRMGYKTMRDVMTRA